MKPRFNRSSPSVVKIKAQKAGSGRISRTQANEWKYATPKTLAELAAMGKITPKQVNERLKNASKKIRMSFRDAFVRMFDLANLTEEDVNRLAPYASLLF